MSDAARILPRPTALSAPYWDGCNERQLRLQHCEECATYQFYPRLMCSSCGSDALQWRQVSGSGTVASFTVVRRGLSPAYKSPYIVALIDLAEGPRMMSQIVDTSPENPALRVGAAVQVQFQPWSEEALMPVFRLTEQQEVK